MKNFLHPEKLLFIVFFFILSLSSFSQIPLKSPTFADDVFIEDNPTNTYKNGAVCCAPNGWLYAFLTYDYSGNPNNTDYTILLRSTDAGLTWSRLYWASLQRDQHLLKVDLIVLGSQPEQYKIWAALTYVFPVPYKGMQSESIIYQFNGMSGEYENYLLWNTSRDVSLVGNNIDPSQGPTSVGVVINEYSYSTTVKDSLNFYITSDQGASFQEYPITTSTSIIHKNSIAFGVSPENSDGKFFCTWEEHTENDSLPGKIYESHNVGGINSPFTVPVRLDNINPSYSDGCRYPIISCQKNSFSNDSSEISEVIFSEYYDPLTQQSKTLSFRNNKAYSSSSFEVSEIGETAHNLLQPNVVYRPGDTSFYLTYFDSTSKELPILKCNVNSSNWQTITSNYSDDNHLSVPYPKIGINANESLFCNWSKNRTNGNKARMFDAEYLFYSGVSDHFSTSKVFPNPCNNFMNIEGNELITNVKIYDCSGRKLTDLNERNYNLILDMKNFNDGIYLLVINNQTTIKIIINHN